MLFADVSDSTTIYESIGDTQALALINRLFRTLNGNVAKHGGFVVKTLGDGMVCQFVSADEAFHAACDMQASAHAVENQSGPQLTIKIGFTFGPVVVEGGDVFGDTVNVCSRLSGVASPGQVLTTQETVDALSDDLRERTRQLYPLNVRGRVEEVKVCEVLWRSDPDRTEALSRSALQAAARKHWVLKLTYAGESVVVEPAAQIKLGRDKTNEVVVPSTKASRVHARIYSRGGNFVIADQSSNGTWLMIDGHTQEVTLRREEALLGERGYIGLGGPASTPGDHVLRYSLEQRKG